MKSLLNSVVIVGFKHTGKTVVGRAVAEMLDVVFLDLDQKIELLYEMEFDEKCSVREIMQKKGEGFFRALERDALAQMIGLKPGIISLGGGAPLDVENQKLMRSAVVVHLSSAREVVFERIVASGRPAFFSSEEDLSESFNRIWDDRQPIYEKICDFTVENKGEVSEVARDFIKALESYLASNPRFPSPAKKEK